MKRVIDNTNIDDNEDVYIEFNIPKKVKITGSLMVVIILIVTLIIAISYFNHNKTSPVAQTNIKAINLSKPIISFEKKMINIGEEFEITIATETEEDKKRIRWESSNPEIISINNGKITGLSVGKAKICAYNGSHKSNELEIECFTKITNMSFDKTEIKLPLGSTEIINVKIEPSNATYKDMTWSSSNKNIAKVQNGKITGLNVGKCEIKAVDYTNEFELICNIEVVAIDVESLTLDETDVTIGQGQKYILFSSYTPDNATYKDMTWASNNSNVIKVDNGIITAVSPGNATVTVTAHNGIKATCDFTVTDSLPNHDTKYARNDYNLRSGPGTEFSKIGNISKNDELQILKTANGWSKVRITDGTVGFVVESAYSETQSYMISNVPYINQFSEGYPTGCEAVSAAMAAQYSGYNVSPTTIINNTPTDERGIWKEIITVQVSQGKAISCAIGEQQLNGSVGNSVSNDNTISNAIDNTIPSNMVDNTVSNTINNTIDNSIPTDNTISNTIDNSIPTNTVDNTINNTVTNDTVNNTITNTTTPDSEDSSSTPEQEEPDSDETPEVKNEEIIYGGNPFTVFVGHPSKRLAEGSYGCFAGPIVTALTKSGVPCTDISNSSRNTLLGYIREGKPVIVWCVKNAGDLVEEETWQYPDGSGSFTKLKGEHCAVLIGYDDNYVYLNDPSAGENVKQPIEKFFSNWNQLYCQAIIIN